MTLRESILGEKEMPNPGFWTVDDIVFGDTIRHDLAGHALLRMVHASEDGPGGIRYLLAQRDCVEIRHPSAKDENPKFSYGLAYHLSPGPLSDSVEEINYGIVTARTPVVTMENLGACVQRRHDAEHQLSTDLHEILAGLGETQPPEGPELPPETGGARNSRWSIRIHVGNVGQGDTIVLEFPGPRLWIIDAYFWSRSRYDEFRGWLNRKRRGHVIEKAIISHCHYDHIRSMEDVIRDFSPNEVLAADIPTPVPNQTTNHVLSAARRRGALRIIHAVEDVKVGETTVRLLPTTALPGNPSLGQDPNEHGIIVAITTQRSLALLPGDAPGRLLGPLVRDPFFYINPKKRFYKVTHHCSRTGDDPVLLSGFMANDSVTSCSKANRFGHPHDPPEQRITMNASQNFPPGQHRKTFEQQRLFLSYELT
jgi:competence protein ComEC